jgi:hypothetical protein
MAAKAAGFPSRGFTGRPLTLEGKGASLPENSDK